MAQHYLTLFDSDGDNTAQACRTSGGILKKIHIINPNSTDAFLQLFDAAVADVNVGTTTPKQSYLIPAGNGVTYGAYEADFASDGLKFATAITYACTTTATGSGDPTTGLIVNMVYI